MAWGISAAMNAIESTLSTGAEEEFQSPETPPPGAVCAVAVPAELAVPQPLLPRRIPVAALSDGPRAGAADGLAPVPGPLGPRPDLDLLAQVLAGLQRMA